MISKNNQPNAAQKRWQSAVRECGCIVTGSPNVDIEHLWGASFKHDKEWIGQWAVIALDKHLHARGSGHPFNKTDNKKAFHNAYGSNAELFEKTMQLVAENFPAGIQPPQQVIDSILDWGRNH